MFEETKQRLKEGPPTSGPDVPKWEDFDRCDRQVRRYIRLTELISPLLDKVDGKNLPIGAGTELSFLNVKAQSQVNDYLERELCTVTEKQAAEIHRLYELNKFSEKALREILREKEDNEKFSIDTKKLRSYFPKEYSSVQCKKILWEILDEWFKEKGIENNKIYCN